MIDDFYTPGNCYAMGIPDTKEAFMEDNYNKKFVCVCTNSYETYYPKQSDPKRAPEGQKYCNSPEVRVS